MRQTVFAALAATMALSTPALADASGVVRDEVLVEVRGASVKQRR